MIEQFGRTLPYTREQAFDIAADIERYPEFLEWWLSAHITGRNANTCYVEQEVGLGPIRVKFASVAVLQRPERIDVTSTEMPFRNFKLSWVIAAVSPKGCRVGVAVSIDMRSGMLQLALQPIVSKAIHDIIVAFESRAHALYAAEVSPGMPFGR